MTLRTSPALRRLAAVAVGAVALGALAGCGGQPQGATTLDKDADVTLTWWTGQDAEANDILEGLAGEFEKDHPNVTIDVSPGASSTPELLQKLSAGFAGGNYPDISYAYGSWASQLEESDRTLDITEQVADPDVKWDEFSEAARATVQPSGDKTIGFPAIVDNISLIYNRDIFDAAGLDYPDETWSWDDFRDAAAELTDASTDTYGYGYSVQGGEDTTWQFWPHLWQNGGEIMNEDGTKATFDSQAGIDALTLLRDMAVDDKSIYLDQTDTKYGELFKSGRIAMITSGPWQLYDLKITGTNYGVTILPGTDGDHQTVSGPDIWALFDHQDKNREYWAYEFGEWLTSAEQDERWNVEIGNLPLRSSEIDSDAFQAQITEYPGIDIMAANGENAVKSRPTVPGYVGLSEAIGTAISEVMQGQGDPEEALKKAAEDATDALERLIMATTDLAPSVRRGTVPPVRRKPRGRMASQTLTGWLFVAPATVLVLGLSIFPAAWALLLSFQDWDGFKQPEFIGGENYAELITDADFFDAASHTGLYTLLFVPASVFVGLFLAVALNRKIRFIGLYRTAIFVPFVASAAATGILSTYLFSPQFGLVNNVLRVLGLPQQGWLEDQNQAMLVIAIMSLWGQAAFTTVIYLAALQDMPIELLEAARLDGATRWQAFWQVVWPQLTPVTVFTTIWQTIGAIQLFDLVYTTTRGGPLDATKTIVYYLWEKAFRSLEFGYGSAVAYALFALTLLITIGVVIYARRRGMEAF